MATCDFSGVDEAFCDHCKPTVRPRPRTLPSLPSLTRPGWYTARHRGACSGCGEPYTAGTQIFYQPETDTWIAECCDPAAPTVATPRPQRPKPRPTQTRTEQPAPAEPNGDAVSSEPFPIPTMPQRVKITPAIADDWLENRNLAANRNMSEHVAAKYAKEMAEGRWLFTHQGIAFDTEGWLIDGQHRLRAIVLSGTAVEMFVVPDCDAATFAVLDNGYKRQAAHLIQSPGSRVVAAAARILAVVTGEFAGVHVKDGVYDTQMPTDVIIRVVEAWPELAELYTPVDACYRYSRVNRPMHLAVLAQAMRTRHRKSMGDWFDGLTEGAGLAANDPRLLLRNRFIRDSKQLNPERGLTYNLIAKAWNAHATGRPLGVLKVTEAEGVINVAA